MFNPKQKKESLTTDKRSKHRTSSSLFALNTTYFVVQKDEYM